MLILLRSSALRCRCSSLSCVDRSCKAVSERYLEAYDIYFLDFAILTSTVCLYRIPTALLHSRAVVPYMAS